MAKDRKPRIEEIVGIAERMFGEQVLKVTAPGGKSRDSYRMYLGNRSVIVTWRSRTGRAQREILVLRHLSPRCRDMPRLLGFKDNLLFQSDLGEVRLSQEVHRADPDRQADLAAEAVASIFRIQSAARSVRELDALPHLGATGAWVTVFVDAPDRLARLLDRARPGFDRAELCERLAQPPAQFTKWDCRPGNAALAGTPKVAWFDFEYSGRRHGAEDIAFLMGDEVWPVAADTMFDIVTRQFDPGCGHARDDYLEYLGLYATFHAVQRIKLVLSEVDRRGWSTQERALRYDKVGTHPLLGARLCAHAAQCADRHVLTRPLRPLLDDMSATFLAAMPASTERLAS